MFLGTHPQHVIRESCFNKAKEFYQKNNQDFISPYTREVIDMNKVVVANKFDEARNKINYEYNDPAMGLNTSAQKPFNDYSYPPAGQALPDLSQMPYPDLPPSEQPNPDMPPAMEPNPDVAPD